MGSVVGLRFGFQFGIRRLGRALWTSTSPSIALKNHCYYLFRIAAFSGVGMLITLRNQFSGRHGIPFRLLGIDERLKKYGWKSSVFGVRFNIGWAVCLPNLQASTGDPTRGYFL